MSGPPAKQPPSEPDRPVFKSLTVSLSSESLKNDFQSSMIDEFDLPDIDDDETDSEFGGKVEQLYDRSSEGLELGDYSFVGFSDSTEKSSDLDALYHQMAKALEYRDKLLVKAVIKELEKEIRPKLKKMEQNQHKYELLKKIYKLPSVSNLASQDKKPAPKQPRKSQKSKRRHSSVHQHTPLTPISEESDKSETSSLQRTRSHDTSHTTASSGSRSASSIPIPIPIPSLDPTYNRAVDQRDLRVLSTIELISIKNRLQNRTFPDVGRITGLVLKFEQNSDYTPGTRKSLVIRKLNNKALLQEIEFELNVRGEVSKSVL
ncbi:hypothetical protein OGAPHI_005607 [Ogataea philodendri]|uniref:Uncharacterized protein n=1 Tax=Ogataea philodendri TaxID=1378263 RepID=A0A9P8NZ30_9ASCO|nr:uncharacterized protein OGAPHI_005607 [Ogataea philodendri]KAH3662355.1 hypothetical protein OGAPHI_005607 [Ogataea philodendri]